MPALWRPRLQPVFAGLGPEASSQQPEVKIYFTFGAVREWRRVDLFSHAGHKYCLNHGFNGLTDDTDKNRIRIVKSVKSMNPWQSVIQTVFFSLPNCGYTHAAQPVSDMSK